MTTLILIDGHRPGGRRSAEVAARFRSELGRLNISASEAARRVNKTQAWMARRTSGKTPFDVDDLDMCCRELGMSYEFVAAGAVPTPPPGYPSIDKPTDCEQAGSTPAGFSELRPTG